jgi:hypothetical protein
MDYALRGVEVAVLIPFSNENIAALLVSRGLGQAIASTRIYPLTTRRPAESLKQPRVKARWLGMNPCLAKSM